MDERILDLLPLQQNLTNVFQLGEQGFACTNLFFIHSHFYSPFLYLQRRFVLIIFVLLLLLLVHILVRSFVPFSLCSGLFVWFDYWLGEHYSHSIMINLLLGQRALVLVPEQPFFSVVNKCWSITSHYNPRDGDGPSIIMYFRCVGKRENGRENPGENCGSFIHSTHESFRAQARARPHRILVRHLFYTRKIREDSSGKQVFLQNTRKSKKKMLWFFPLKKLETHHFSLR